MAGSPSGGTGQLSRARTGGIRGSALLLLALDRADGDVLRRVSSLLLRH